MSEVRLKLGYKRQGSDYLVGVVEQDEALRGINVQSGHFFESRNGWRFASCDNFDVYLHDHIVFVRGRYNDQDDAQVLVTSIVLKELAVAVAELNGRKNVVKLGESGVIV